MVDDIPPTTHLNILQGFSLHPLRGFSLRPLRETMSYKSNTSTTIINSEKSVNCKVLSVEL